ncbi:MAG: chemotaxis protein CheA [Lautropia sp.]
MQESTAPAGPSSGDLDLTQFYQIFFEEAGENLEQMEAQLLALDVGEPEDEQLNAIFRCAHSIKGGAATFGFQDVASLTHVMETLLDRLRRHELALHPSMVDVLLESGDALRSLLGRHQGTVDTVPDHAPLAARIAALAELAPSAAPVAAAPPPPLPPAQSAAAAAAAPAAERSLGLVVGPGASPDAIRGMLSLFDEIDGLGRCVPLDAGTTPADGTYRFELSTRSSDADLLDLMAFHLDRGLVKFEASPSQAVADAPAAQASGNDAADGSYGFFVDLPTAPVPPAASGADVPAASDGDDGGSFAPAPGQSTAGGTAGQEARHAESPSARAGAARGAGRQDKQGADAGTIRVSVDKVDQLINLVGELVITQAMLEQTGRALDPAKHQTMIGSLADLERSTRMMQEAVMAIRMIPMAVVFNRFPRMLRDLAARLDKKVDFQTRGEATELDKGVIEKITDPLTHLVRNAVDHGIESPQARRAAGKPEVGTLVLSAEHRGGSILIEVRDDGKGLSREKLLAKARERGMPVSDAMSDTEVWGLIFEPGFSTAEVVSDVSGRGVGMDVVRRNIQSLGGSVEVDSALGVGTRVSVRLPLTLAIMDGMSVGVGDEIYIVPLGAVIESIQLDEAALQSVAGIDRLIRVRDEYLPLVALDALFGVRPSRSLRTAASGSGVAGVTGASGETEAAIVLVVEAEGMRCAVLVDRLIGQHQVVVKNLEANYRRVDGMAGATILGDGHVALILDIGWLVRRVRN